MVLAKITRHVRPEHVTVRLSAETKEAAVVELAALGGRAEVMAQAPSGPLGPTQLRAMPYLMQVVDEVKRTCPNVPMSFGRAKCAIVINALAGKFPSGKNPARICRKRLE